MNINASIIDQRLAGVQDKIKERATEEFTCASKPCLISMLMKPSIV